MEAQVVELQRTVTELVQRLQQQQVIFTQELEGVRRQAAGRVQAQAKGSAPAAPQSGRDSIDLRQLGKTEVFTADGQPPGWRDWSSVFRAFVCASRRNMKGALDQAEGLPKYELLNATLSDHDRQLSS